MRIPWKYVGLAGLAGVAATGVVVARRRRAHREDIEPDELRAKLHERLDPSVLKSLHQRLQLRDHVPAEPHRRARVERRLARP